MMGEGSEGVKHETRPVGVLGLGVTFTRGNLIDEFFYLDGTTVFFGSNTFPSWLKFWVHNTDPKKKKIIGEDLEKTRQYVFSLLILSWSVSPTKEDSDIKPRYLIINNLTIP